MNLNLHIKTLKRAKADLDEAIVALEKFRKHEQKRGGLSPSHEAESVVKERKAITDQALRPARRPGRPRKGKAGPPKRGGSSRG